MASHSWQSVTAKPVTAKELPDAPSAQVAKASNIFEKVTDEAHLPSMADAAAENDTVPVIFATPRNSLAFYETTPSKTAGTDFFGRYFSTSSASHPRYQASDNNGWMGRATDAASRILVTRDESGRRKLNTFYLLRVATSVAAHSASRPYWLRSGTEPISDFGSTVGNDAGMNLLHEFGPAVRHVVTGHLPEFVTRIEEGVVHSTHPR